MRKSTTTTLTTQTRTSKMKRERIECERQQQQKIKLTGKHRAQFIQSERIYARQCFKTPFIVTSFVFLSLCLSFHSHSLARLLSLCSQNVVVFCRQNVNNKESTNEEYANQLKLNMAIRSKIKKKSYTNRNHIFGVFWYLSFYLSLCMKRALYSWKKDILFYCLI